jgi:hypothetical protein
MIGNQLNYSNIFLGFSTKYTLASDGCAVFALARCLNKDPIKFNQELKDQDCFAYYNGEKCIIDWAKLPTKFPQIKKCIRVKTYDNDKVLEIIEREGTCIVCVDYDGSERTVGDHFVVYIGDHQLEDPLGGQIRSVDRYPLVKGYVDLELVKNSDNNMTQEETNILNFLKEKGANEGEVRKAFGALEDNPNLIKKISDLETSVKDLDDRIVQLEADAKANNDLILGYQTSLTSANQKESKLQTELKTMSDEKNSWKNRYESKCQETIDKYSINGLIKEIAKRLFNKK